MVWRRDQTFVLPNSFINTNCMMYYGCLYSVWHLLLHIECTLCLCSGPVSCCEGLWGYFCWSHPPKLTLCQPLQRISYPCCLLFLIDHKEHKSDQNGVKLPTQLQGTGENLVAGTTTPIH
jgi:hypothetical protein